MDKKEVAEVHTGRINILGVWIDALTVDELHDTFVSLIARREHAQVLNVNVNCLNLAYEHRWLRDLLNAAEVVFCDGDGVRLGARWLGHRLPTRITYADWLWELARFAEPRGYSFVFLGARPGVADRAAARLQAQFPSLRIVGTHHGFFDKSIDGEENRAVLRQINEARPNILVLGFGMPLQERWLLENWDRVEANIVLTGGAVFDYVSGELARAPRWMTDHGLEWLGRLFIEPKRLWKRYLVGNPVFLYRVLQQRLGRLDLDRAPGNLMRQPTHEES